MKINSYEDLTALNEKIKVSEKKLLTKRKALIALDKKANKMRDEISLLEEEMKSVFMSNNNQNFNS